MTQSLWKQWESSWRAPFTHSSPPSSQASLPQGSNPDHGLGSQPARPDLAYSQKGRERPSAVPICCLFGLEGREVFDHASEKRRPFCRQQKERAHVPRLHLVFGVDCPFQTRPHPTSKRASSPTHLHLHSLFNQQSALHFCIVP